MNPQVLIVEAVFAVLAGPIAGVTLVNRQRSAAIEPGTRRAVLGVCRTIAWQGGAAALAFSGASAMIALALAARPVPVTALIAPYATLWAAALALGMLGAVCASCFPDPLDAAGCSVALALVVAAGVLVLGPIVAFAPTAAINAALVASPIVATVSAANIDLLRGDVLYRVSPLAHMRFDYPSWQTAFTTHFAVATGCFTAMALRLIRQGRTMPAERISL